MDAVCNNVPPLGALNQSTTLPNGAAAVKVPGRALEQLAWFPPLAGAAGADTTDMVRELEIAGLGEGQVTSPYSEQVTTSLLAGV